MIDGKIDPAAFDREGARAMMDAFHEQLRNIRADVIAQASSEFIELTYGTLVGLLVARMHELSRLMRNAPDNEAFVDAYQFTHEILQQTMVNAAPLDMVTFVTADLLALVGMSPEVT